MSTTTAQQGGISFFSLLTIVFITLKLTGVIAWSWWWVMAPLWLPVAIFLSITVFAVILIALFS